MPYILHTLRIFLFAAALPFQGFAASHNYQPDCGEKALSGRVMDAGTGEPLPAATVYLPEEKRGTVTDPEGGFCLEMESGPWLLEVQYIGYETARLKGEWPHEDPLQILLEPETLVADEVIVTASPLGRNVHYQPAHSLHRAELDSRAAPSVGEMLDGSPGLAMRSFGSAPARPVIRGMDGERVLVMENGERMGDLSSTAHDHAIALDPLSIERVEVVRGPASLLYGSSALGGVVNLFSRDLPQEWSEGSGGTLLAHLATVNGLGAGFLRGEHRTERLALTGSASYRSAGDLRTPEGPVHGTFLDSYSGSAGIGYRRGGLETGISLRGMTYDYGLPGEESLPGEGIEVRMDRLQFQSFTVLRRDGWVELAELRLSGGHYRHSEVEMMRLADLSGTAGEIEEELQLGFDQTSGSATVRLQHRPLILARGVLGWNAQARDIRISGVNRLFPGMKQYSTAFFLFQEMDLTPWLSVQGGARIEFQKLELSVGEQGAAPRSGWIGAGSAGLNLRPADGWQMGAQLARAYRVPTIEELYSNAPHFGAGAYEIGDPDLDNEVSVGADLFFQYRKKGWMLQGSAFMNRISGFINFRPTGLMDGPSGLPVFEYHATRARLYGAELAAEAPLASGFRSRVTLDYMMGSQVDGETTPLPFIPPFRVYTALSWTGGRWSAELNLRGVLTQKRTAPEEEPTRGYFLAGFNGSYRLMERLSLMVRLDNALNTAYRDHLSRIEDRNRLMPGRNFNLMLRWDF